MHEPRSYYDAPTKQERATAHPERLGVAQKCTFCKERIDDGQARGLKPGVDPEATPACASSCISQAIQFGDFNDPASHVSQLLDEGPSLQLNAALGTDPQIKYLYTTPAVPGRERGEADEERLADPANPLVGPLQTFWDWRAAMNWIFGGAGTGLAMATALAYFAGRLAPGDAATALLAAAALVATGLFCVFLKIGRKLRFWRAATRPQSSWMTRELYATPFFFAGALWSALAPAALPIGLAGLGAAAFLACQAKILHRARGIPAWRAPLIPWMIFATGLAEGAGAFAVLGSPGRPGLAALAGLVVLNLVLWRAYVGSAKAAGIPPLARRALAKISPWLHVVGHALPLALIGAAWSSEPRLAGFLAMAAGAAALFGGVIWKFRVIVRAGYFQGFDLPRVPQRGSGRLAAPARLA
jgi:phenylacetyl-CoA:acceptor oxidoreductase subunit 2